MCLQVLKYYFDIKITNLLREALNAVEWWLYGIHSVDEFVNLEIENVKMIKEYFCFLRLIHRNDYTAYNLNILLMIVKFTYTKIL